MTDAGPLLTPDDEDTANPPLPSFVKTVRELISGCTTIKSTLPSPLISAAVSELSVPNIYTNCQDDIAKPPLPSFVNTVSVPGKSLPALIKSTLPSPFTSAATTEIERPNTPGDDDCAKPPLPLFVNTVSV